MSAWQILKTAFKALMRNTLRSVLTVLGVVIGVASVVAMVGIGEGAQAQVEAQFAAMGSDLLIVMSGATTRGGAFGGFGSQPTLTWEDLKALQAESHVIKHASAVLRTTAQAGASEANWSTSVQGTDATYFQMRRWRVKQGEDFSKTQTDCAGKYAWLGTTVVSKLYGAGANPVGSIVRVKNIPLQVMGVFESKGQSPVGTDYDDAVFVSLCVFQSKLQPSLPRYVGGIVFVQAHPGKAAKAMSVITQVLRERHHLQEGADDDFSIRNLAEMAQAQEQGARTFTVLLASIALVSLLVGGIGIMNIMLVSVTERTQEIGLRMAVGATPKHILWQFLAESLTLSWVGGLTGTLLGYLAAWYFEKTLGWPIEVQPSVALVACVCSGWIGVFFGLFPAYKASRLHPIVALRHA
jgi:putative ABC transport system permease protein